MCTLSFIPGKPGTQHFTITSNRDESPGRETFPPKIYNEGNAKLLYPKDGVAGGTWIGASDKNRLVCLMNGAFSAHRREKKYRMSRGIVVKKLLLATNSKQFIQGFDLAGIEPFTIVMVEWKEHLQLVKLVWDGTQKHLETLPVQAYIWSASMLYSEKTKKEREKMFRIFLAENPGKLSSEDLLRFHKKMRIDRKMVKTTSITQFVHTEETSEMVYSDLRKGKVDTSKTLDF